VVVASWYPTRHSATGSFVQDQVYTLAAEHDIAVVAPDLRRFRGLARLDWFAGRRPTLEEGVAVARPVVAPPIPRAKQLALKLYARAVDRAIGALGEDWARPDVVHAHVVSPAGWAAARWGIRHRVPVVLTEHSGPFAMHLRTAQDRANARWTLEAVAQVVAVGPGLERQITSFARPAHLRVVGNVVDTDFFAPETSAPPRIRTAAQPLRLVTVSSLVPGKGIDTLLRALRDIQSMDGVPATSLIVIGDGPDGRMLRRLAGELRLGDACQFVGAKDRMQVREWLRWADLFVLPSHAETFSIATAEAMSCGTPVVVTRSGGPEHFVTPDAGIVVEPGDATSLANVLARVATSEVSLDGGAARRIIVERFSRPAFLATMRSIYTEVIDRYGAANEIH
jgi:glycosyltransferase involved in cell wall biosynthesis